MEERGCEFIGTALLLLGGLPAVFLDFGPESPMAELLPSPSARLLLTGLLFAGTGSLIAISPLGRRSGAHLNPAVTLAFWVRGQVHAHDLAGYVIAQLLGALAGTALLRYLWGSTAQALHLGATAPHRGLTALDAALIEAAMTAGYLLMILNPARSFGPAVLPPLLDPLWAYVVGPLTGALLAAVSIVLCTDLEPVTAKLFHDPAYRSTLGSKLPVAGS